MIVCALACATTSAFGQTPQEVCGVFARQDAEHVSYIPIPGYSILAATAPLTRPPGQPAVDAVICDRASIYLGALDHRVLTDLAVPFYVRAGARLAALEISEGQLRIRFLRGAPLPEEGPALSNAIDRAHEEIANARRARANQ